MRRYDKGQIIGTFEPPMDRERFFTWLDAELSLVAEKLVNSEDEKSVPYLNGRQRALQEVQNNLRGIRGEDR